MSTTGHDIFDDLFAARANEKALDPRFAAIVDPEAKRMIPLLASGEEMAAIFEDVVRKQGPSPTEAIRLRTTGEHIPEDGKGIKVGHRVRVEYLERPIDGFVAHVNKSHWAAIVLAMLNPDNPTTFIGNLKSAQSNGDWTPIAVQTRIGKQITQDGRRRISSITEMPKLPGLSSKEATWHEDFFDMSEVPQTFASAVSIDVLQSIIVWCDRLNARDLPPIGPDGKPILDQIVHIQNSTDPALVAAIERIGSGGGGGGSTDTRLVDAIYAQGERMGEMADAVQALAAKPNAPVEVTMKKGQPGRPRKIMAPITGEGK